MLTSCSSVGSFLFHRILQEGEDSRFQKIRGNPKRFAVVWIAQAVWVSVCALPVLAVNSIPTAAFSAVPGLKIADILGLSLYAGGLLFEVVADQQRSQWMADRKAKIHDEEFLTRGLWSTRFVDFVSMMRLAPVANLSRHLVVIPITLENQLYGQGLPRHLLASC
jgi:steroid 5-alpha reductase family enzyme